MKERSTKVIEKLTITKYKDEEDFKKGKSYEESEEVCESGVNCLLNAGITKMWNLIIGGTADPYANDAAQLGIGNGTATAVAAQTNLQGASTLWKAMEATYPQVSNQKVTFQSEFGADDANYDWEECAVRNGGTAATVLNRVVFSKGTKVQDEVWTAKLEITLS